MFDSGFIKQKANQIFLHLTVVTLFQPRFDFKVVVEPYNKHGQANGKRNVTKVLYIFKIFHFDQSGAADQKVKAGANVGQ